LKLQCDEPLSNFTFNFNLRRYETWKNGIALAKYDPDVIVVKVPATLEGVKAANALVADGGAVQVETGGNQC